MPSLSTHLPLPRHVFDRRVALKATASFAAMAAAGLRLRAPSAHAQSATSALTWVEDEHGDVVPDGDGWRSFALEAPFHAVAPTWNGEAGGDVLVEIAVSIDGARWSDPVVVGEAVHDAGPLDRDGRRFGELIFADGASLVRYRAMDGSGQLISVQGLAFICIDSSAGPDWAEAVGAETERSELWEPPVISRAAWGADESYRFDRKGRIQWPEDYLPVKHIIVHHTVTPTFQDPLVAVRAIYYYHAIERGWGDIGYNYLVDHMGNVYEGRSGGENVIGGHAYQYAHGSCGIGLLGDFTSSLTTPEAQAGLVWITAWVGRELDPYGSGDFHETADLPTICAHRDVNDATCPGAGAYGQLDTIRDHVAAVLAGAEPTIATQFYPGDTVQVVVNDANLRDGPGAGFGVLAAMPFGAVLAITERAASNDGYAWYGVSGDYGWGWCAGSMLERIAGPEIAADGFVVGDRVVTTDGLNLRTDASRVAPVQASAPPGTAGMIIDGPRHEDGFIWHRLETDYGRGWAVGLYLAPRGSGTVFAIGDRVVVDTDAVVLRSAPGRGSRELAAIPGGVRLKIIEPPVTMGGHDWYGVRSTNYGEGWAAGTYLSPL